MALQCGIVGLPNVGKSTLFNCLSSAKAESANYPFCTIEPNIGIITVPDERLQRISDIVNPQKIQPTTVEIVDIAGLVKGASKGEGLGNQFLGRNHGITMRNSWLAQRRKINSFQLLEQCESRKCKLPVLYYRAQYRYNHCAR